MRDLAKTSKNVVIIGGGFIGCEVASSLKSHYKDGINIHMVYGSDLPLELAFGKEVAKMMETEHLANGIKIHNKTTFKSFKSSNNKIESLTLKDDTEVPADLVIVGIGSIPSTQFLQGNSSFHLEKNGAVRTDPFLSTGDDNIYAAGDITSFPYWLTGEQIQIEHYVNAQEQGTTAAYNMLGKLIPYGNIPFFWTRNYNKSLQQIGYVHGFDDVHVDGSIEKQRFLAYYLKKGKVVGVAGSNRGGDVMLLQEALFQNVMPSGDDIKSGKETIETIKGKVLANKGSRCKKPNCCHKKPASQK